MYVPFSPRYTGFGLGAGESSSLAVLANLPTIPMNPALLAAGVGVVAIALWAMSTRPARRKKRAASLRSSAKALSAQAAKLEVD